MESTANVKTNEAIFQELGELITKKMEAHHVPGVAIGMIVDGQEYTAGYGITHIENPLPVTPDTLFQIGSTTKTITATAIFQLVDAGKISLDDPVRKYLPDLKLKDENVAQNVTVRQLLNHTGGWVGDYFTDTGPGDDSLAKYVELMADLDQLTPLGEVFCYNNAAFNLAGRVIEAITGKTYEQAIQEMVLDPLGMKNSFFFAQDIMMRRFAVGHTMKDKKLVVATPFRAGRCENACGGLDSSARDQLIYARFHMGDGTTADGNRLLSDESIKLMQTPSVPMGEGGWMGLNWFLEDKNGYRIVSHGGSTNGQKSSFWMVPEKGFACTVLTNGDDGSLVHDAVEEFVQKEYLGIEKKELEAVAVSEEQIASTAGSYSMAPTNDIFTFAPSDGGLEMSHTVGDHSSYTDVKPEPIPNQTFKFYAEDKVFISEGDYKGIKGEFMRGPDGKVAWFRFSARLMKRIN